MKIPTPVTTTSRVSDTHEFATFSFAFSHSTQLSGIVLSGYQAKLCVGRGLNVTPLSAVPSDAEEDAFYSTTAPLGHGTPLRS